MGEWICRGALVGMSQGLLGLRALGPLTLSQFRPKNALNFSPLVTEGEP